MTPSDATPKVSFFLKDPFCWFCSAVSGEAGEWSPLYFSIHIMQGIMCGEQSYLRQKKDSQNFPRSEFGKLTTIFLLFLIEEAIKQRSKQTNFSSFDAFRWECSYDPVLVVGLWVGVAINRFLESFWKGSDVALVKVGVHYMTEIQLHIIIKMFKYTKNKH